MPWVTVGAVVCSIPVLFPYRPAPKRGLLISSTLQREILDGPQKIPWRAERAPPPPPVWRLEDLHIHRAERAPLTSVETRGPTYTQGWESPPPPGWRTIEDIPGPAGEHTVSGSQLNYIWHWRNITGYLWIIINLCQRWTERTRMMS